ncbi:hypothetical protein TNCV_1533561 [Trichonephila clavipes]|nr:hypothetical protein TNCV_1533561 [Trichonephila clavipes]
MPAGWRGWFVEGLLPPKLRVQPRPKLVDFHDAENRQRSCRKTIRHLKDPCELNNHGVQELWFQQDGATCHTARATIDLLKDTFGDRLISRFGPVNWPPRS